MEWCVGNQEDLWGIGTRIIVGTPMRRASAALLLAGLYRSRITVATTRGFVRAFCFHKSKHYLLATAFP